jgi:hypothetical protein
VKNRTPLLAVGALALLTACGSAAPSGGMKATGPLLNVSRAASVTAPAGKARTSATGATATCVPVPGLAGNTFSPIDASFTSASDGWLLGVVMNDCASRGIIEERTTVDGGLHWAKALAPPAPWGGVAPNGSGNVPLDGVTRILFANARDGWAYGPGLWVTHNGGVSWHEVSTHRHVVYDMAVTSGYVVATFDSCGSISGSYCSAPATFTVETTPVHHDAWRPTPGAAGEGAPALTAAGGTAYAYGAGAPSFPGKLTLLVGPANGSSHWHSQATPCPEGAITASAASASHLLLACALLGAHPTTTHLYRSADGGARWKQFATRPMFDGARIIEQSGNGTLLVGGIYNGIELSYDGGRTWAQPAKIDDSNSIQGGGYLAAALVTNHDGYVIGDLGPLWITRNGGKSWRQISVH